MHNYCISSPEHERKKERKIIMKEIRTRKRVNDKQKEIKK